MIPANRSLLLSDAERAAIMEFLDATNDAVITHLHEAPDELKQLLAKILQAIKSDQPISISVLPKEITTTTAASMLNVSRPTVMKYIHSGRLSARKVGTHHRLNTQEVLELLKESKQQQREATFELMDLEDSLEADL